MDSESHMFLVLALLIVSFTTLHISLSFSQFTACLIFCCGLNFVPPKTQVEVLTLSIYDYSLFANAIKTPW